MSVVVLSQDGGEHDMTVCVNTDAPEEYRIQNLRGHQRRTRRADTEAMMLKRRPGNARRGKMCPGLPASSSSQAQQFEETDAQTESHQNIYARQHFRHRYRGAEAEIF